MIYYGRTDKGRIKPTNVLERLWKNSVGDTDEECWELQHNNKCKAGHIRIRLDDTTRIMVHRLAWEAYHAERIPAGLLVCHKCDNPSCFNPHHLFLGTQKDNMQDKINKGRSNTWYKLSREQRAEIKESAEPTRVLAEKYGVTSARILQIKKGD